MQQEQQFNLKIMTAIPNNRKIDAAGGRQVKGIEAGDSIITSEGAWVPELEGPGSLTYTTLNASGRWTRVGSIVSLSLSVSVSTISGEGTGNAIRVTIPSGILLAGEAYALSGFANVYSVNISGISYPASAKSVHAFLYTNTELYLQYNNSGIDTSEVLYDHLTADTLKLDISANLIIYEF